MIDNDYNDDDDVLSSAVDPLIFEIYLFNNNYKDRLLISELREKANTVKIPELQDSSFFVRVDDVWDILNTKFKKDLNDFDSTPEQSLNKSITSIYFIKLMILRFDRAKYIKVSVSDSLVYSRKVKDHIKFDFRIIHSRVDLPHICTSEFLTECKRVFQILGLYQPNPFDKTPYFEISAIELFDSLEGYTTELNISDPESDDLFIIQNINLLFGKKLQKDNSIVLVIVEE